MASKGIGREFMERTRYKYLSASAQQRGLRQPPLQVPYAGEVEPIVLPAPDEIQVPEVDLRLAIEARESVRRYAETPLSLAELSYLLWCTQGVKGVQGSYATFRNVPSAGARHALECYLLLNRVEGLQPGLYRFLALEHVLVAVDLEPGIADAVARACLDQQMVVRCAATFIWVAVDDLALWAAWLSLYAPRRGPCLPESLPGRRVDRRWGLCHRRLFRRGHEPLARSGWGRAVCDLPRDDGQEVVIDCRAERVGSGPK
jgi:hypothetical protein